MRKKLIVSIIIWIVLYVLIFRVAPYYSHRYAGCSETQYAYDEQIKAVILKKYIDKEQHNFEKILYRSERGPDLFKVFSDSQFGDLYDQLHVGDSIIKEKKSYLYRVRFATTGKDTVFKFETFCKDSLAKKK